MTETEKFYVKLFISICARENSSHPAQVFLFYAGTSLSLLLDTIDAVFNIAFFQHRNKTKATKFTKRRRETSLLHILSHKCLKSFGFIILLSLVSIVSWHEIRWTNIYEWLFISYYFTMETSSTQVTSSSLWAHSCKFI